MKCKNCKNVLIKDQKKFCSASCQMKAFWKNNREKMLIAANHPNKKLESSTRMKKKNPMWIPGIKERAMVTNKALGTRPKIRGGNGQEMPVAQRTLLSALGNGWYAEHSIATKLRSKGDYPTCYKIDVANPKLKIAIEVDGQSHNHLKRREQDKKKTKFLERVGWKVFRFKNEEIMTNLNKVLNEII